MPSLKNIIEGISDAKALEAEIKKVENRIKAFEITDQTVAKGISDTVLYPGEEVFT